MRVRRSLTRECRQASGRKTHTGQTLWPVTLSKFLADTNIHRIFTTHAFIWVKFREDRGEALLPKKDIQQGDGVFRKGYPFTEIPTMFEHANQKGLISLSVPPVHWDLHVVDVGQRHFQLPVEGRVWTQSSFNTDRKQCTSYWLNPGLKLHP